MKLKEVEEMRKMPDSDKLIGHLSNLVKEDSKELEEKELMEAEVASYSDKSEEIKSEVTKFEETKSEETKGELVVLKPASGRGQQYTEQETMEVQEKSVTAKEVSELKAATSSSRMSIPAGRVEDRADKEPTQTFRRRRERTRPLASRKKIISADSSLKCPRTGPSLKAVRGKKPDALRNIWVLFTRFRGYKFSKEEMNKRYTMKLDTKAASKDKFSRVLKTETRDVKSNLVPNLVMHRSDVKKPDR